jgi:hypothetical protein
VMSPPPPERPRGAEACKQREGGRSRGGGGGAQGGRGRRCNGGEGGDGAGGRPKSGRRGQSGGRLVVAAERGEGPMGKRAGLVGFRDLSRSILTVQIDQSVRLDLGWVGRRN